MLAISGLRRRLPTLTLQIDELEVPAGACLALLGPIGAGKSSLLETLAGFGRPDSGTVEVEGRDVTLLPPDQRGISVIFQQPSLFPHLDVRGNLLFGSTSRERLRELCEMLALAPLLERSPGALSGGERQLVALARALMVRPRVLLLDEPFTALDPESRRGVIEAVRRIRERIGVTLLLVTHNFEDALSVSSRVAVLLDGRLEQAGLAQEVFHHPANLEIARFLGAENLFSGEFIAEEPEGDAPGVRTVRFQTGGADLRVLTDRQGPGHVLIQPQDITLSLEVVHSSALNQLRGTIRTIAPRGALIQLQVDAGLQFRVWITAQSLSDMGLEVGSEVRLVFKASAVRTF